ncbi:DNA mismatch repair protein MutL [Amylolactobacillus amylotrophicus DSM 20534]|uniref:DNA mismatch repair protein MutL n=3 Tax=Amylolactobacillus TaxID=2767876 RepID=A0A0R1YIM5_9LACO|nr:MULTISPECIES: DNA mismatch repair endonuclease MutL [Amylolactobacillus]APT18074.1 hypothetical protein LA20533_01710 [Amylolactobacillus amylophilus DSM 20533 = JCM 1125]KRK37420.1 DNA mismatch repair protein MutL [Amylolactobacillus amylotrophicus DSM 20534]KRM42093.1 DNA mismatch repair protein MutL [Amylolactobacillus amylophilus DSM 20533 = JCM 1125]GED80566.1 DNA mismatch repair protein MutL [Amylolactobacillus amylophilus]
MAEIKELSPELSDQIAAGEVIERPSSVVKELLENAIDAGSSQIKISFVEAGLREIVIEDNGSGIAPNQLDLAFRRHATSKISTKADLFKIRTLGFRGEALASISAVAHVAILTNTGGAAGVSATFADGRKLTQKPAAAKKGTRISVRDLFYNTPARLKYLKSETTETTKIIDIVNRIALSHPELKISLKSEKKDLLLTNGSGDLRQDMAHIYGRIVASQLIEFSGSDADFVITGLMTPPDITRANRNYISILLNGRYIKNFQLSKAIMAGYGSKIGLGKFPIFVLNIKLDPLLVDVNVHPTKQEVRLSKESSLSRLIINTVAKALERNSNSGDALTNLTNPTDTTSYDQMVFNLNKSNAADIAAPKENDQQAGAEVHENSAGFTVEHRELEVSELNISVSDPDQSLVSPSWAQNVQIQTGLLPFGGALVKATDVAHGSTDQVLQAGFPALTYIGQLHNGLIVADSTSGFYLVDAKEAMARLRYNKLEQELTELTLTQQVLLTPIILELNNTEYEQVLDHLDLFKEVGLVLEDFGRNSLIMKSHPNWIPAGFEEKYARATLNLYFNNPRSDVSDFKQQVVLFAVQQSVQHGQQQNTRFNLETGQSLLDDLQNADSPYQSPTGKLILVHFSKRDLQKMFKRVQKTAKLELD